MRQNSSKGGGSCERKGTLCYKSEGLSRERGGGGLASQSRRLPFWVGRGTPGKASAKEKFVIVIPRQNGYLNGRGERQTERTVASGLRSEHHTDSQAGSALSTGLLPSSPRRFQRPSRRSTLAKRVPDLLPLPGLSLPSSRWRLSRVHDDTRLRDFPIRP